MKKNKWIWIILIIIILAGGIGAYLYFTNNPTKYENEENEYEANKTSSTNENKTENNENGDNKNITNIEVPATQQQYKEETIATFSTKIYNKESARQNNINITCGKLNNTTVKNGETFSFVALYGQATTAKGYQKADIFDKDGNKKKGLGGGNCQISSTLYNAVLAVPSLSVTERHAHSNYVPYIQKGKDAAVAYGSYDFKFVNNTGNDITIHCSSNGSTVDVSINSRKPV